MEDWRAQVLTLERPVMPDAERVTLDDIAYHALLPLCAGYTAYRCYHLVTSLYDATQQLLTLLS
ncbi:hypothetical protein J4439_04905 [Candidatus Woesearchaeota archaeon]|nr:hypothetical protein [Candidatus Woesearchaeota archaeon]